MTPARLSGIRMDNDESMKHSHSRRFAGRVRALRTLLLAGTEGQHEVALDEETITGVLARVILFNDDVHTFDEVINQLRKATGCSMDDAEAMTIEVHTRGKATVYEGEMPACLRVTGVLEEIALHAVIEL